MEWQYHIKQLILLCHNAGPTWCIMNRYLWVNLIGSYIFYVLMLDFYMLVMLIFVYNIDRNFGCWTFGKVAKLPVLKTLKQVIEIHGTVWGLVILKTSICVPEAEPSWRSQWETEDLHSAPHMELSFALSHLLTDSLVACISIPGKFSLSLSLCQPNLDQFSKNVGLFWATSMCVGFLGILPVQLGTWHIVIPYSGSMSSECSGLPVTGVKSPSLFPVLPCSQLLTWIPYAKRGGWATAALLAEGVGRQSGKLSAVRNLY